MLRTPTPSSSRDGGDISTRGESIHDASVPVHNEMPGDGIDIETRSENTNMYDPLAELPKVDRDPSSQSDGIDIEPNSENTSGLFGIISPANSDSESGGKAVTSHLTAKWVTLHVIHGLLVAVHIVAVAAAFIGWSIDFKLLNVRSAWFKPGVTAGLQVAFHLIVALVVSLAQGFAIDAEIRRPPTLGVLHLRIQAWSGLFSSLRAAWSYPRPRVHPESAGLQSIFFYLGFCTLLQISSSSIFATTVDPNLSRSDTLGAVYFPAVPAGARFGDFDALWASFEKQNVSSVNTLAFPAVARNAAVNMFAGRTNDTRNLGLHGRLLHDTVSLAPTDVVWNQARVSATLVNVHCSQISNATINTFTLPFWSTNMSLAKPSPHNAQNGSLFPATSNRSELAAWINVSLPAPPYWDPNVVSLDITGYWSVYNPFKLPTRVFFQPWSFGFDRSSPMGYNQLVMVIASENIPLVDATQSIGNALNLTLYPGAPGAHVYIQVIGCTAKHDNLIATIDQQGRLLNPLTSLDQYIGPEAPHDDHAWDEFEWEGDVSGLSGSERQFLLAFTPSSPAYNDTSGIMPVGIPETALENLVSGDWDSPFLDISGGSLERLFASYLWNINRLCTFVDHLQQYWENCGPYSDINGGFGMAEFDVVLPRGALIVVEWRAIVSLVCCVGMWFIILMLLEDAPRGGRQRRLQQAQGLLDSVRIFNGRSRVPEMVVTEMMTLGLVSSADPEMGLLRAALAKRLKYVEPDDGLGDYLDVDDSDESK
ncbi:hypothetical protein B0H14DRAFT_2745112 [Mycena olivaceomarginata]|nr:hypothetical protein B0H14DRAFT_2745112 [Mycena olivaceomarginata]